MATTPEDRILTVDSDGTALEGELWLPGPDVGPPTALLTMHPGSGPSDRHNDVFFPPIRAALLAAGVAVASFDKRGVGGSGGSWLDAGIEQQARDLLAGHAAASSQVPGVPSGVFGHSQGGWVVLEALRVARPDPRGPTFGITSSGPGVPTADQERFAADAAVASVFNDPSVATRARDAALTVISMYGDGVSADRLASWVAHPDNAEAADLVRRMYGDDVFDEALWNYLVQLAAFDPVPAMESIDVPLLAVFGSRDTVTPVEASVAAFSGHVRAELLEIAIIPGGDHRIQDADEHFVPGYPQVLTDFIRASTHGLHAG